jgi:hypothetical protein
LGTAQALAPLGRFAGVLFGISLSAIAISLLRALRRLPAPAAGNGHATDVLVIDN